MKTKNRRAILIAVSALLLALLACGPQGEATPTPTPTVPQMGEASPAPPEATETPTPTATTTPVPDVSGPGGCTLNAKWVADVTVPDNTEFPPGASFTKTWRVRNSGTCAWEAGTQLAYVSGDALGGPASVPVGAVAPGSETDVSVNLVAPSAPGTYQGNWQMQAPDSTHFGSIIWVKIVVPEPPTDTPTPTDTPEPTQTSTPTKTPKPSKTPTPTKTPPPGACVAPNADLKPVLDRAESLGYDMGCPTAAAFNIPGVFQEFWTNVDELNPHLHYRSLMIWRSDNKEIYVIDGRDTDASEGLLMVYTDTWEPPQPELHEDCAGMTVPDGYELPVRGFGKVWCVNDLEDEVGWPDVSETGVTLLVQPLETGLLLKVYGPIPIWYLVALDYRAVYAVTMMTGP